jgi:hypothetical protein
MKMKRKLLISEKDLRGEFAESIYSPVAETDSKLVGIKAAIKASRENHKHLEEIDAFFKKDDSEVFRFFPVSVADGKAFYQIINYDINSKQFLVKRCKGICLDEYADGYLGEERWVDFFYAKGALKKKDALAEMFKENKKVLI